MQWFNPGSVVQLQHLESNSLVIDVVVKDRAVLPNPNPAERDSRQLDVYTSGKVLIIFET